MRMKFSRLPILVVSLLTAGASTASAAPATASGPAALALAGVVALYSPLLTADEREAVSAFFVGQSGVRYARKISVTADKIVCRVSNVDITARSCELTFKGAKQTISGRRASEIFATEAMAGIPADGAAGSVFESLSKLNCTLDPAEITKKTQAAAPIARSRRATEAGSGTEAHKDHATSHNVKSATCHFIQLEKECCSATRGGFGTFFGPSRAKYFSTGN
jgi:hypothetical protein